MVKKMNGNTRNGVADTFLLSVIEQQKEAKVSDANYVKIIARITELQSALNAAIKHDKVFSGLEDVDIVRDGKLRNVGKILEGLSAIPVAEMAEAAKSLFAVFKKYGYESTAKSYDEESSDIESMKADFAAAERAGQIKVLPGFAQALEELWAAEAAFKAQRAAFVKASANAEQSATAIKKQAVSFVNSCLLPYVDAAKYVNDEIKAIEGELAKYVERANATAR